MAKIDLDELLRLLGSGMTDRSKIRSRKQLRVASFTPAKKKRKASPYQLEVGRQLKKLKKAHPRTKVTALMKRAHRAAKKVRK